MQKIQLSFSTIFRRKKTKRVSNEGKMLYLESVRGLAALTVVLAHILTLFFPYPEVDAHALSQGSGAINHLFYGLPFGFLIAGHFAVLLFFILSGYVLTYRFYETKNDNELRKQAAKRYFRLAIPVFATVMTSYFLLATGAIGHLKEVFNITGAPAAVTLFQFTPDLGGALYDATIGVLINGHEQYNPVLWTMTIEFIGSFVVFGFAMLIGKLRYRWAFYIAALVALSNTYYLGFIIGLIFADLKHNSDLLDRFRAVMNKVYLTGLLVLALILASIPQPWTQVSDLLHVFSLPFTGPMANTNIAHYLGASIIMLISISIPGVQQFLSARPLVWLGSLSFAIYLTHTLVLYSLGTWLFAKLWDAKLGIYYSAGISGIVVVIVTLGVAVFWKKYIDDMSVRVSRSMAGVLLRP
jgi:peptidoglycan/LPS O-acetylase OafA/YrhL